MSLMALGGGTGVAHADSDAFLQPVPGIINQMLTSVPALSVNPANEGGPSIGSHRVGMYCENQYVRCR
jgi:hypothetical protein